MGYWPSRQDDNLFFLSWLAVFKPDPVRILKWQMHLVLNLEWIAHAARVPVWAARPNLYLILCPVLA
jgi:hypothetical protein